MFSPQQNVGHSAPAAQSLASPHAKQTSTLSSDRGVAAAPPSKARTLYDSVSHLSRKDAITALTEMSSDEKVTVQCKDHDAYSRVLKLVVTEGEIENRKKEARIASNLLFELLEDLPRATGERLNSLRTEILALGGHADQAQNRVEQLQGQVSEMISDL